MMLDRDSLADLALELRDIEKRITWLYASLKQEKDKKDEILKKMDLIMDNAVEQARRGEYE